MLIEQALATHLANDSGISAIVGTRIYAGLRPQKSPLPSIVYSRVSGVRIESLQGSSGLARPRFQIDCCGKSYPAVKNLAEAIRLSLEGFRGTMGGGGGVVVQCVRYLGDIDFYSDDEEIFRVALDFEIWHNEPRPSFWFGE